MNANEPWLSMIVAVSLNGVIGRNGELPWHLPSDLARFRYLTMGHFVLMGRRTYQALPERFRPLPGRENIVLTRGLPRSYPQSQFPIGLGQINKNTVVFTNPIETLAHIQTSPRGNSQKVFIIGGEQIFKLFLPLTKWLYLTEVQVKIEDGDAFFPEIREEDWELCERFAMQKGPGDDHYHTASNWRRRQR